ncbi:MAG TPA: LiaF domain-containing protein [Kofleriaceae bacterium]|jgi:hypothetical protein|nr:LiaF domain-containing protein [Kofleriaceae bacterium]
MAESLVALRDRREQVIQRLSESYAEDLFDVDELERRLDIAHSARKVAELDALVEDVAALPQAAEPASTALVVTGPTAIDDPNRLATKKLRVIMSSVERRGRWSVPRELEIRALWGNVELDLRDASLGPGVTTIHVRVVMANCEIILPPSLAVDVDVSSFAGNVTERHRMPPEIDPARPVIRLLGSVAFGNVEITTRLPGESARDMYRRERRERKQLRRAERDSDRQLRRADRQSRRALRRGDGKLLPPGS